MPGRAEGAVGNPSLLPAGHDFIGTLSSIMLMLSAIT